MDGQSTDTAGQRMLHGARALGVGVVLATVLVHLAVAVTLAVVPDARHLLVEVPRLLEVDRGNALLVLVAALPLAWAWMPPSGQQAARWLRARELSPRLAADAMCELQRVRRWRTVPTAFALLLLWSPGSGVNLAMMVDGVGSAAYDAMLAQVGMGAGLGMLGAVVVGYLLGTVAGEATRRPPADVGGSAGVVARLETRRPASYLTAWARRLPWVAAALLLAVLGVRGASGHGGGAVASAAVELGLAAGLLLTGGAVQRWVVRRPQRLAGREARAYDDTFRSSAAHAVAGVTTFGLLALVGSGLGDLWNLAVAAGGPRWLAWALAPLVLVVTAGSWGLWLRYGSAHPGRRPAEVGAGGGRA